MLQRGVTGAVPNGSVGPKTATTGRLTAAATCIAPESLPRFRSLLVLITHLGWQPLVRRMEGTSVLNTLIEAGASGLGHVHREAQQLLRAKVLRHSSQVDVAVSSLYDFPPSRGSFMSHFARAG